MAPDTEDTGDNYPSDHFGIHVKLDAAGKTLVIGHDQVGGTKREGTLEVYQDLDDGNDQFVHATTMPTPTFDDPLWGWCRPIAVSEVGHIVRSCFSGTMGRPSRSIRRCSRRFRGRRCNTPKLRGCPAALAPTSPSTSRVSDCSSPRFEAAGVDTNVLGLSPRRERLGARRHAHALRQSVPLTRLSADGKIIAIAQPGDDLVGRGPLFPPYLAGRADRHRGGV